jgi:hypothetical protein
LTGDSIAGSVLYHKVKNNMEEIKISLFSFNNSSVVIFVVFYHNECSYCPRKNYSENRGNIR